MTDPQLIFNTQVVGTVTRMSVPEFYYTVRENRKPYRKTREVDETLVGDVPA